MDSRPWCLLVSSRLLSFVPSSLQVTRLLPSPDQVIIEVRPGPTTAQCPTCGLASRKIHSVYRRVLADLPWRGDLCRYGWQRVGSVAQIEYAHARHLPSG